MLVNVFLGGVKPGWSPASLTGKEEEFELDSTAENNTVHQYPDLSGPGVSAIRFLALVLSYKWLKHH